MGAPRGSCLGSGITKWQVFVFYCKATKNYLHSHTRSEHLNSMPPLLCLLAPAPAQEPAGCHTRQ